MISYCIFNPTGNITALVKDFVPEEKRVFVASEIMKKDFSVEQVGFMSRDRLTLRMAGNEFCGNATMSCAACYCFENGIDEKTLEINVSGAKLPVPVAIKKIGENEYSGSVQMPKPSRVTEISLEFKGKTYRAGLAEIAGITHLSAEFFMTKEEAKEAIKKWQKEITPGALGIMFVNEKAGTLTPLVYVPEADTVVFEGSCASGTSAAGSYFAWKKGRTFEACFAEPRGNLKVYCEVNGAPYLTGKTKFVKNGNVL